MIECFTRSRNPATLFTLIEVLIIKNVVLFLGLLAKSLFIISDKCKCWRMNGLQSGWKWRRGAKIIASPFPYWYKTQTEKKILYLVKITTDNWCSTHNNRCLMLCFHHNSPWTGLNKFNICVHWFLCPKKGFVHMIMHVKLRVHKTVKVGANLHHLIYNVLIDIIFPIHFAIS